MPLPLKVYIDGRQTRIARDRTSTLVSGDDWDPSLLSNCWIDPVTGTLMLLPAPLAPEWETTTSGIYDRLAKADYTLATPTAWQDDHMSASGDTWLFSQDVNEAVVTTAALRRNQGVHLGWFAYDGGGSDRERVAIECGWGEADLDHEECWLGLRFYVSGKVEVFRFGEYAGEGRISGTNADSKTSREFVTALLIPCRKRELLVVAGKGSGFSHVLEDLDETEEDPEIVPAAQFWWHVPSGKAKVQLAPLRFRSSGYAAGVKTIFRTIPPEGVEPDFRVYSDVPPGGSYSAIASLTQPDDVDTPWEADGVSFECRLVVDLVGDGYATPFVYGALASWDGENGDTDAQTVDLTPYLMACRLSVPDSPNGATLDLTLNKPAAIEADGAAKIFTVSNRPILAQFGAKKWWNGRSEPPEWIDTAGQLGEEAYDESLRFTIRSTDPWKAMEDYLYTDPIPLDGRTLTEAWSLLASGFFDSEDFETIELEEGEGEFTLSSGMSPSKGEFAHMIEAGDSAGEKLMRLVEDFAANFLAGCRPTDSGTQVFVRDPATIGDEPEFTLYASIGDAQLALPGEANPERYVYRSYKETVLEPEANDVWVTGLDARTGRPVQSHAFDESSMDPTLAAGARPDNWLGELRRYAFTDPAIRSQAECDRAAEQLLDRLGQVRRIGQWECEFMVGPTGVPLWRTSVVKLDQLGVYRIRSIEADFEKEPDGSDLWQWRPANYVGELLRTE